MASRKGIPNKVTKDVREAVGVFATANVDRMGGWLAAVADGDKKVGRPPDPGRALDLYLRALEYHIPKLARQEHTGPGGGPVRVLLSESDGRL